MRAKYRDMSPRRLFVVAAGNAPAEIASNDTAAGHYPIEDPPVVECADDRRVYGLTTVTDAGYAAWLPLVGAGHLRPHSRTSVLWPQDRSPFKPELVFEAGTGRQSAAH